MLVTFLVLVAGVVLLLVWLGRPKRGRGRRRRH
jgi:hypothetical protein